MRQTVFQSLCITVSNEPKGGGVSGVDHSPLHLQSIVTIFSCPPDSSIGSLVTESLSHSVTHSLPLLKNTTKEHSERLVTLETIFDDNF